PRQLGPLVVLVARLPTFRRHIGKDDASFQWTASSSGRPWRAYGLNAALIATGAAVAFCQVRTCSMAGSSPRARGTLPEETTRGTQFARWRPRPTASLG